MDESAGLAEALARFEASVIGPILSAVFDKVVGTSGWEGFGPMPHDAHVEDEDAYARKITAATKDRQVVAAIDVIHRQRKSPTRFDPTRET